MNESDECLCKESNFMINELPFNLRPSRGSKFVDLFE